ncbi:hypothetical protein [Heyndrickxia coagulans]|uniref:PTS cellobiose transporter subunit IIA n=1 Tax=Heyndrickxia coagulans 36D1 TaxID=345219 RepID=G2TQR2_HEYCO|nr:hypothetical protein [Heyndrickxia coagulans]AEO99910.1 hypothetical protein Bcoa_0691 [Heyndrickxia coagulans 36D1]
MNDVERALFEKNQKNQMLKSMYYNRYLLVRYVTAIFFFTNVYWLISLVVSHSLLYLLPLALIIVVILSVAEQVKIYSSPTNHAKYTKFCFMTLLIANVILLLPSCFSSSFAHLYPFLINQNKSKVLILAVLIAGIFLSAFILYRLYQITHDEDKHFQRIMEYEKAIR